MISLVLSHETALAFWRHADANAPKTALSQEEIRKRLAAGAGSVHVKLLDALEASGAFEGLLRDRPLDLLTADRNDRRKTRRADFHCMQTELPEGSMVPWRTIELPSGTPVELCVCTPEFVFVQMAHLLGELELAELGCELCGGYRCLAKDPQGYIPATPLTTPERLLAYATRAEQMTGGKRTRKVAAHVLAHARNPQQAKLALMASLPRSMGGIGTPKPVLDHVIEVPEAIARVLGSRTRRPDLFWPEVSTAVEYENRSWNDATAHAEYEARKADAYHRMGLEVISLTRAQLEDLDATRRVFEIVVRACGKRRSPVNERQAAKQQATHHALFSRALN